MNKINGIETNVFVFEAAIKIIEGVIKIASHHHGKLYGSYLRNVIIPRLMNQSVICNYGTIHFIFENESDYNEFINELKNSKYYKLYNHIHHKSYKLMVDQLHIAFIQCFVNHPHDLDINTLHYYYENDVVKFSISDNPMLINKILSKKAMILSSFITLFKNSHIINQELIISAWNQLIESGWILYFNDLIISTPMTLRWFLEQLQPSVLTQFKNKQKYFEQCLEERNSLLQLCLEKYEQDIISQGITIETLNSSKTLQELVIDYLIAK